MQHTESACFSDDILQEFACGQGIEHRLSSQIEEHLALCSTCAERVRSFVTAVTMAATAPLDEVRNASAYPAQGEFLSTQTFQLDDSTPDDPAPYVLRTPPNGELPVKVGPYFIIKRLGKGGFGTVYLARDTLHQRQVALKVPRTDRIYSKTVRRDFLREARFVADLHHPHIVPLYDCHELDDGRIVVAMKYIEGMTLRAWMRDRTIPHHQAAQIVLQVALALQYAHQRPDPIWHRDVKPENILLDDKQTPYLTDFGLGLSETEQANVQGQLAGTHAYMSPEQIQGQVARLDGRSDLWSLGVVLYELLTRKRPFEGESLSALSEAILKHDPQPPRQVDRTISPELEAICLRCLAKEPSDRFASAAELAERLKAATRVPRWSRRRIGLLAVTGLLCGLPPLALSLWANRPGNRTTPTKETPPFPKPLLITWTSRNRNDFFQRESNGGLQIHSLASHCCFETHAPQSTSYMIEVKAMRLNEVAVIGLALNIHDVSQNPQRIQYLAIEIDYQGDNEPCSLRSHRFTVESSETEPGRVVRKETLAVQPLPVPRSRRLTLQVEVAQGRVTRISLDGMVISQIPPKVRQEVILPGSHAGISAHGHVLFSQPIVKE